MTTYKPHPTTYSDLPEDASTSEIAVRIGVPEWRLRYAIRSHLPKEAARDNKNERWTRRGQVDVLRCMERVALDPRYDNAKLIETIALVRCLVRTDWRSERTREAHAAAAKVAVARTLRAHEEEVRQLTRSLAEDLLRTLDAECPWPDIWNLPPAAVRAVERMHAAAKKRAEHAKALWEIESAAVATNGEVVEVE